MQTVPEAGTQEVSNKCYLLHSSFLWTTVTVTGPWVLSFGLQLGTHIEIIPEREAKREANLGLEEWRGEVRDPLDKLPISNTWPIGEEGNTWASTKKGRKFSRVLTTLGLTESFPKMPLHPTRSPQGLFYPPLCLHLTHLFILPLQWVLSSFTILKKNRSCCQNTIKLFCIYYDSLNSFKGSKTKLQCEDQ